jgi:hypothetical protein
MMPALDTSYTINNIFIPQMEQQLPYVSKPPVSYYLNDTISKPGTFLFGSFEAERALALKTVHEFGAMKEGWDGYGAMQIHGLTCKNCLQFLNSLPDNCPFPELTPNSNGTISMEWESQNGGASLEIGKTRYSFYIKRRYGDPVLRDGDAREIGRDIAELVLAILYPSSHYAPSITTATYNTHGCIRFAC